MKEIQKAVIFDMDGIIFDSERLYAECWELAGEEYQLDGIGEVCRLMIGVNDAMTKSIFEKYYHGIADYDTCRSRVSELYHARCEDVLPLKPGVYEILGFLKDRDIPFALASSTRISTVSRELKDAGLDEMFQCVIGGDMIKRSKPEPDIFLVAAKRLDVEPCNCYVMEDSYNGISAAYAAGMHPIMIPDLLEPTEEMRQKAETICPSLLEAMEYLREKL